MPAIRAILIFASGVIAAVGATWVAIEVRAQAAPDPVIHACGTNDGVLHLAPLEQECPAGQRSLLFKRAESDLDAPKPDEDKKADACPAYDKSEIAALQDRLKALESVSGRASQGPSRVVAPFEVVDKAGRTIFQVAEDASAGVRYVIAYNAGGIPVTGMRATRGGGLVWGEAASRDRRVLMGAGTNFTGLEIEEGPVDSGKNRVSLGRDPKLGTYRVKFFREGGQHVAGMGEAQAGNGVATIHDKDGNRRVELVIHRSHGYLSILGTGEREVASLAEGERAGGLLTIFGVNGEHMVEAGVAEGGFGVVRAGPESFKPGAGLLGLPGSYIAGKPN